MQLADESIGIREEPDILSVRQAVRQAAKQLNFGLVDQTKIVTAASELARNALIHGGGGRCTISVVCAGGRTGLRLIFEDDGPGIADINQAMREGFSTQNGLGLGLSGAKRLVNEFELRSEINKGTSVTVTRWK